MALDTSKTYPLLPLRDAVVFPHTTRRILVGRDISLRALEYAESHDGQIILSAQKNIEQEELENPMLDLYSVGILAHVSNVTPFPNGCVKVVLEGDCVVDLRSITTKDNFLMVTVSAHKPAITDADKSPRFETDDAEERLLQGEEIEVSGKRCPGGRPADGLALPSVRKSL